MSSNNHKFVCYFLLVFSSFKQSSMNICLFRRHNKMMTNCCKSFLLCFACLHFFQRSFNFPVETENVKTRNVRTPVEVPTNFWITCCYFLKLKMKQCLCEFVYLPWWPDLFSYSSVRNPCTHTYQSFSCGNSNCGAHTLNLQQNTIGVPLLSGTNRNLWLQWAQTHHNWKVKDWLNFWSDGSEFSWSSQVVASKFDVSNMNPWTQPVLCEQSCRVVV